MAVDYDHLVADPLIEVYGHKGVILYTPAVSDPGAAPYAIRGIFDPAHVIVLDAVAHSETKAPGHSTTAPVLTVKLAAFAVEPQQNDTLTIDGVLYYVWDTQPDGQGMADLILRRSIDL